MHRYAMVVLATADEKRFVASLLEAPAAELRSAGRVLSDSRRRASAPTRAEANYTIDTVRRVKQSLKKVDRLYFLMGIDAFREIATWHQARALLGECDFVVASRPGYSLKDVAESLPDGLRPPAAVSKPFLKQPATGDLILPGLSLHLLEGVEKDVSATAIRAAAAQGKPLGRWLDPRVVEYIRKVGLYRKGA
jgi:nicotinate-nucleotide adenylyltransferase